MDATAILETRVGIYADDLTGALDAAAPFAAAGMSAYVSLFGVVPDDAARRHRVLSLNVDTRHGDRFPVFDRAARAAKELRAAGFTLLINKIDSTLRGHAGMEARAGLSPDPSDPRDIGKQGTWSGPRLALIVPSFPAMGRVVIDGRVLVNGVPLAESEVGRDPLSPVASSDISELVELNTGIRPSVVTLEHVRNGDRLRNAISDLVKEPPALAVCDAETDEDLGLIAGVCFDERRDVILSGSAGITTALARTLFSRKEPGGDGLLRQDQPASAGATPALIISGSQRSATERQLEVASDDRAVEWLQIDPTALLDEDTATKIRDDAVVRVVRVLERGSHAAVSLTRADVEDVSRDHNKADARTKLVRELGAICYRVVRRTRPGALVLIGGDTAQSALRAAGAAGIVLQAEPIPGVPAGTVDRGLLDGVRVVTKAGAFGNEDVLVQVIDYLN